MFSDGLNEARLREVFFTDEAELGLVDDVFGLVRAMLTPL